MISNLIFQGAEATITKKNNMIMKERLPKSYRIKELDNKLRKQRTKKEIKLLEKAKDIINVPQIISHTEYSINLEEIKSKNLANDLEKIKNKSIIAKQIGLSLAKLHDSSIIHGDLTTSNVLFSKNKVYFIDFGLGYESNNVEDKAVDLHVLKEALIAKHPVCALSFFNAIISSYKKSKSSRATLARLEIVEKRGRYKQQY